MFKRIAHILNEHKILRGMLSYAVLWPTGSLLEQTFIEKRNWQTYDWKKCLRFSLYGAVIMEPTMYVGIRIAAAIWPRTDFRSSVSKAITEQFTYDPASICTFLFVMSLLENRTVAEAKDEILPLNLSQFAIKRTIHTKYIKVRNKFLETYRVGVIYWPTVQTLNFSFVPVKNQVVCTSFFSMIWSAFLAYEKHLKTRSN